MELDVALSPDRPEEAAGEAADLIVTVRRQWNDHRAAAYSFGDVRGWHWGQYSGGRGVKSPHKFVSGWVMCDRGLSGRVAHSCKHGPPPHKIKIVLLKKDNLAIWPRVIELAGERPPPGKPSWETIKRKRRRARRTERLKAKAARAAAAKPAEA